MTLPHALRPSIEHDAGLLGAHPGWVAHAVDADGHAARLVAALDVAADGLAAAFPLPHDRTPTC